MTVFRFLKSYFYLLKYSILFATIILILADVFGRLSTYFGSRLVALISTDISDRFSILNQAIIFALLSAGLLFGRLIALNGQNLIDGHYIPYLVGRMQSRLFQSIHEHSPRYFEQEMSGNLTTKIGNVTTQFEHIYFSILWTIYQPLLSILTMIISILLVNFSIGLILSCVTLIFLYVMYRSAFELVALNRSCAQLISRSTGVIVDSISNAEIVKSFGHTSHEKKHLFSYLTPAALAEKKRILKASRIYLRQGIGRIFIQTLFMGLPIIFWYYEKISFADYIFIQGIILTMNFQIGGILFDLTKTIEHWAVMQEALDVLYHPIEIKNKKNASDLCLTDGAITLNHITFGYTPQSPVFQDFSLTVHAREKIGLVGGSGSGKSTLIKLLCRYYDVDSGAVLIDHQNIADITQKSLHENISYVMQEPALLNRTILENIRYGKLDATDEEVIAAAKKAYCHDFILKLPNGYDSKVGERGVLLSGGERQRIAIARAILKDAPILILDEATSALDSESELFIQKALNELMKNKTVIAIAHRLSTLNKMDRLIVLENGCVTEMGSHADLIRHQKRYYQFYQMQHTLFGLYNQK